MSKKEDNIEEDIEEKARRIEEKKMKEKYYQDLRGRVNGTFSGWFTIWNKDAQKVRFEILDKCKELYEKHVNETGKKGPIADRLANWIFKKVKNYHAKKLEKLKNTKLYEDITPDDSSRGGGGVSNNITPSSMEVGNSNNQRITPDASPKGEVNSNGPGFSK